MPPKDSKPGDTSFVRISFGPQDGRQDGPAAIQWESNKVNLQYHQENIPLLSKACRDYLRAFESPRVWRLTLDFALVYVGRSNCSFCLGMLHGILDVVEDHWSDTDKMELILTYPDLPPKPTQALLDIVCIMDGWMNGVVEHLPYIYSKLWLQLPLKAHPMYARLLTGHAQRLTRIILDVPELPDKNKKQPDEVTKHQLPPVVSRDGKVNLAPPLLESVVLNGVIFPPLCSNSEYAYLWKYPGVTDFTYRIAYRDQVDGLRGILDCVFPALERLQIVLDPAAESWHKVKMCSGNKRRPIAPNVFVPGSITPGTEVQTSVWDLDRDIVPEQPPQAPGTLPRLSSLSIYIPCIAAPKVAPDWVVAALQSSDPLNIKYYEYYF